MNDIRDAVRERYGRIAAAGEDSLGCCTSSCGSGAPDARSLRLGYSREELASAPGGADLGLGCGSPEGIALLEPGETVLDLGSGGGLDCFLAAEKVGPTGRVIGVDMTPEMVSRARENAARALSTNVEFRLGEIEHLPVANASVDVILSNCVINLSPDKQAVYREAYRALKPGGRLAITDVVATAELPEEVRQDLSAYTGCIAGALEIGRLERLLAEVGFADVRVRPLDRSREFIREWMPGRRVEELVLSSTVEAIKPRA